MDIALSLSPGHNRTDLESLFDWLQAEKELRGRVSWKEAPPKPGEMGGMAEFILVAAGSGGFLSVLATSVQTWLAQPRRSNIKIRARRDDGVEIEVDAQNMTDERVQELLRKLSEKPE
ncbi:effector-associated constant component EACC1 [Nonomuraea cavernae]|uniref:Uncharacterized protein n=1 Tax=Nonomuraea cavernae TaxID=2045107 RepID=A0A917YZL4_9ACTN|nr:hypothetical protein [Nonomuraea cavernae]MCA2187511.1 hypothetical protein [Nonomuraea cavernae]GGO68851.1 hypothetical protein GCM10012289_28590 [Nonomuraea cavernae]